MQNDEKKKHDDWYDVKRTLNIFYGSTFVIKKTIEDKQAVHNTTQKEGADNHE